MSLLLEALKKAERAKEEAQRRSQAGAASNELRLESAAAPPPAAAEEKPVLTRAELPDIKQPLEILSDDIETKPAEAAAAMEKPAPRPAVAPRAPSDAGRKTEAQSSDRATGKKVFEAKFKESNPRLPFYIVMSLLGVFAIGTVGYFWYQLRPRAAFVNTNPPRNEVVVAPTETKPVALAPAGPAAIPGLPGAPGVAAPKPEPVVAPKPAPAPAAAPRIAAAPEQPRITPRAIEQPVLAPTRQPPQIHPKVETAYTAYQAGNLAAARADYQEALREVLRA